jgi:tRNA dimethylallyltransferase
MSEFQEEHGFAERSFSALIIGLNRDRDALYRRIEERIDRQLAYGLIEETKQLLALGYQHDCAAMKGLGYRQVAEHLAGEYDFAEMVRRFKRDTRRFSKRQMTWFRKESGIQWLTIEESESVAYTAERVIGQVDRFLTTLGDQG